MPEQVDYSEEWEDGAIAEAKIGVAEEDTKLFVAVEPTSSGAYRLTRVDQRNTTVLKEDGLRLLPFALDRLRERFDLEAYGLVDDSKSAADLFGMPDIQLDDISIRWEPNEKVDIDAGEIVDELEDDEWEPDQAELREEETPDEDAHAKANAEQLAMAEEELEDDTEEDDVVDAEDAVQEENVDGTDEQLYESAETYLEDVDEATTAEIADAMGIDDSVDVHPHLEEIDDDRLVTRPHPDDGRKKLYSLRQDGSPPGEVDQGSVVAVAEHYDTLTEVAEDLEVEPLRAHAILEEHGVRDEVVWNV